MNTHQSGSQYRRAGKMTDAIHKILGTFPGFRTLHADGHLYQGSFRAYDNARRYSRAAHLQGAEVPVSVRFSKGGGDPFAPFSATVGMATRFYLPDGGHTNLVMLSQQLFVARTIEEFLEVTSAAAPADGARGLNLDGLQRYLATNPRVAAVFQMRASSLAPTSFARTAFHAVHAFRFANADDDITNARVHWLPLAGIEGQPADVLKQADPKILFDEFERRLAAGCASFELQLELAQAGDPLDDATTLWPANRERVAIGRLDLRAPVTEAELGDALMNHDPTRLTDGIESAGDPIFQIRRGVYEISAAQRSGGWQSCPFAQGL